MTAARSSKPHPVQDVPGIIYDPIARRARLAGLGLEVWEVINGYRSVGYDWRRLRQAFDWLTDEQLRAAVTFANANPEFVAAEIAENDAAEDEFFGRTPHPPDLPASYAIPPRCRWVADDRAYQPPFVRARRVFISRGRLGRDDRQ